jgi:hypothetical protein
VEPLGGDVDVDAALSVGNGKPRLRPEESLILDAKLVDPFDRDVAGCVRVAMADGELPKDLSRVLSRNHGRLRDVVDDDFGSGAARLFGVLGCHERDRLAEIADVLHREDRLISELEAVALVARDVFVGEGGVDAGHAAGFLRVDSLHARGRVGAADRVTEEHARGKEVAGVGEFAGHLRDGVDAADRFADAAELELAGGSTHFRLAFAAVSSHCARHVRAFGRYARKRVVVRGGPGTLFMCPLPA